MWILWPGFLVAIPTVGIVFTVVDPEDLHLGAIRDLGRLGAYSMGFLFFWAAGVACSALTEFLRRPPRDVNRATPRGRHAKS
jgi:hypothetical protein